MQKTKTLFENAGIFEAVMSDRNIEDEILEFDSNISNFWNFKTKGRFYSCYQSSAKISFLSVFFLYQSNKKVVKEVTAPESKNSYFSSYDA